LHIKEVGIDDKVREKNIYSTGFGADSCNNSDISSLRRFKCEDSLGISGCKNYLQWKGISRYNAILYY
jgi:hypothetical protein